MRRGRIWVNTKLEPVAWDVYYEDGWFWRYVGRWQTETGSSSKKWHAEMERPLSPSVAIAAIPEGGFEE